MKTKHLYPLGNSKNINANFQRMLLKNKRFKNMTEPATCKQTGKRIGRAISLVCFTVIAALFLGGCSKEEAPVEKIPRPAKIMTIKQTAKIEKFKFPGKVQALDRVELSFEVSGKLIEVAVREGQRVKKGDLIARLDPTDYKSRLDASQARVNQAKAEYDRYSNLLKAKVVARSTYDVKKRSYEVALSDLEIARKAYNDTMLRASFSGIIGKKFVENYQVVMAKQPIVSLQRTTAIEIVVNAPENIMRRENSKLKIDFEGEFDNYPGERFPLTVKEYAAEADPQTQTFRVTFSMATPKDKTILDGMTATVYVRINHEGNNAVAVPVQAVFFDENSKAYVWKVTQTMHVTRHQIEVGALADGGLIQIKSGLNSGDRIITAGVQNLTEGEEVREFTGTVGE